MQLVLRVWFRKVFISGAEKIPVNQPVILACNHPNSFMDAVLLAVTLEQPLYFLARSDVFNTPLKKWLLNQMHLIPIYRLQEGAENLHKNKDTFDQCYEILKNNGSILIFSEGICVQEKRLRPLKKGTARLAFGATEAYNFNLNVQVIPVALNYTLPASFRKEVMVSVADPIEISNYQPIYRANPAKAIVALNKEIEQRLINNMVILPKGYEVAVEQHLEQERINQVEFKNKKWRSQSNLLLKMEQKVVKSFLAQVENEYSEIFFEEPISIDNYTQGKCRSLYHYAWRVLFLIGYGLNIWPLKLAQVITNKKVKTIEFYASVLMTLGMVFYLLYFLFLVILFSSSWGLTGFLGSLVIPFMGYGSLLYLDKQRLNPMK